MASVGPNPHPGNLLDRRIRPCKLHFIVGHLFANWSRQCGRRPVAAILDRFTACCRVSVHRGRACIHISPPCTDNTHLNHGLAPGIRFRIFRTSPTAKHSQARLRVWIEIGQCIVKLMLRGRLFTWIATFEGDGILNHAISHQSLDRNME